jgi:hypothetical protein
MENVHPPTPIDTESQIEMLLEEAQAFRRAGSPLEALARARVARDILEEHVASLDDDTAEELTARLAFAIHVYERLAGLWQEETAERGGSYPASERDALYGPNRER